MEKDKSVKEKLNLLYKECFKKDLKVKKIEPKIFEEEVYKKFELYLIKKDLKKQKILEEKEKTLLNETKTINYNKTLKKKIEYTGNMDFLERMKFYEKNKKKEIKKMRMKKRREEKKELKKLHTFQPKINSNKLKTKRTIDDLLNWGINKEKNIIKKRNKIYSNEKRKKKLLVRSVHVNNRFYLIQKNKKKNFSSSSKRRFYEIQKNVGERLYDYRVYYNNRKNKKIKLLTKNLFKPRFISKEKNLLKSKTEKKLKKNFERNFININKKTKKTKKLDKLTHDLKRAFLKPNEKKEKIEKKNNDKKHFNEEKEILNCFKNFVNLEDKKKKKVNLFESDKSSSIFINEDKLDLDNATFERIKDFEKKIQLGIKNNYNFVNSKKMSFKKKITLKKNSIIKKKKKSIKNEKESIKQEKKKSIKQKKNKSILKPEKKESIIKTEKKQSILKKLSISKPSKKSILKPSKKISLLKSNSKFKKKKNNFKKNIASYSFNENLLQNLKNSGIGQFIKTSIPEFPKIEKKEIIEINKIIYPEKNFDKSKNLIFKEKKISIDKIAFFVKNENMDDLKRVEFSTKLNSIPVIPDFDKKEDNSEKNLSLDFQTESLKNDFKKFESPILKIKNFSKNENLVGKKIFEEKPNLKEPLKFEENSVSEKLPYNLNERFIEKHETLSNSILK